MALLYTLSEKKESEDHLRKGSNGKNQKGVNYQEIIHKVSKDEL